MEEFGDVEFCLHEGGGMLVIFPPFPGVVAAVISVRILERTRETPSFQCSAVLSTEELRFRNLKGWR